MTEVLALDESLHRVRLTLGDYLLLDGAGAFSAYRKTELIDGEVLSMNAQHRPHARIQSRLFALIAHQLGILANGLEALVETSIAVSPHDVPVPDIVVTSEPDGDGVLPLAAVRLVVEVADATLAFDESRKLPLYARAGVTEFWLVDVNARQIRQMWSPGETGYGARRDISFGETLTSTTIADLAIDTAILG